MWSIIALAGHLPLYAADRLDCVDGAATQRVNGKRGLRVAQQQPWEKKAFFVLRGQHTAHSAHFHGKWGLPSASDPRAKNTGQRATKGTVLTSQSLSPWCDCRRLGSTLASWRWQGINVGNPL